MSLINDALKKAQRQLTGDPFSAAPLPGGRASPLTGGPSAAASGAPRPALLLGGGALLGLVLAGGAFLLFRGGEEPPGAPAKSEPAPAATPAKAEPAPAGATAQEPEKHGPAPGPQPPVPRPADPKESLAQTPATASQPVLTAPLPNAPAPAASAAAAPKSPAEAPRPSTRMVNAIEALRVAGIRAAGNDSKVLMNDRVYRIGDTVDYELGIKLTAATASSLTFVDPTGATYTRYF